MGGLSVCSTAALILFISQGFLCGQTRSQGVNPGVYNPLARLEWGYPLDSALYYRQVLKDIQKNARKDLAQVKHDPHGPQLKTKSADVQVISSPEDVAASAHNPDSLRGFVASGKPEEGRYYASDYQPVFKRPLDTVGSGFMKKEADMDVMKRELDHVGIGLMKRPLDHLGHGLFKKDSPPLLGQKKQFDTTAQDVLGHNVHSMSAEGKTSAVELIKKGLDVVGTGLFKRGDDQTPGLTEMRTGLQQLSTGLGNGDPTKDVDLDMVKRGLDHVGAGLLKRGLDTVGIGLIKRGLDSIDSVLAGKTSLQTLHTEGLGLLTKGLDHLATVLEKNEFEVDGLKMITQGALRLASWVIQQSRNNKKQHAAEILSNKKLVIAKKSDDSVLFESKKSLDELGTGLMKKGFHKTESDSHKQFDDDGFEFKKNVDDSGSSLLPDFKDTGKKVSFMKKLDSLNYKLKKGFINKKKYAEVKAALDKDERNMKIATMNSKDDEPEAEEKGYDVYMPLRKNGLDEDRVGFMKKDLDYVGSGLIKKDLDEPDWKSLDDSDLILKEKLGWLQSPDMKSVPGTKLSPWSQKPVSVDNHQQIPQKKYDKKTKDSLESKYSDKLALKSF